jgi:hypothetical protein
MTNALTQQQQQEQQTNSVNPKTKTALANLLSTRLQTAPPMQQQFGVPQPPIVTQQPVMANQQQQQQQQQQLNFQASTLQQRRSLQNITNGGSNQIAVNNAPSVLQQQPQQQQPQQQIQIQQAQQQQLQKPAGSKSTIQIFPSTQCK